MAGIWRRPEHFRPEHDGKAAIVIYVIIPFEQGKGFLSKLETLDISVCDVEAPAAYFVSFNGTTRKLSEAIGYGNDEDVGSASSYQFRTISATHPLNSGNGWRSTRMATDRSGNAKVGKEKTPTPPVSTPPSDPPESSWIIHGLNQIQEQIDRVEKRIQGQIDGLETRLRRFERFFWICQGILIAVLVIWAIVQFVVPNYQISITPKP